MTDSDDVPLSRSAASALYSILETLTNTGAANMAQAWSHVLNAEFGSYEFACRHGEVTRLWSDALDEIESLPSESARRRLLKYAISWWLAIINPKNPWESNLRPPQIIDQANLDHLANAGELVSARLQGGTLAPAFADIAGLRAQCEEWLTLLDDTEEIGNESFRHALQSQMRHLIWLIDNVSQFGVSRVVENGDQLTGLLLRTSGTPEARVKNSKQFTSRIMKFIAAVAIVAAVVRDSQTIIKAAEHSAPAIERVVHKITDARPGHNDHIFPDELKHDGANGIE